jgi:FKBP-type peptidyl-prolyl cis-trans isomerase
MWQVHYHGRLDDGSVFDSSRGREPLEFVVGAGKVVRGFDNCVLGLARGESRTLRVPAEDAYGGHA